MATELVGAFRGDRAGRRRRRCGRRSRSTRAIDPEALDGAAAAGRDARRRAGEERAALRRAAVAPPRAAATPPRLGRPLRDLLRARPRERAARGRAAPERTARAAGEPTSKTWCSPRARACARRTARIRSRATCAGSGAGCAGAIPRARVVESAGRIVVRRLRRRAAPRGLAAPGHLHLARGAPARASRPRAPRRCAARRSRRAPTTCSSPSSTATTRPSASTRASASSPSARVRTILFT